MMANCVTGVVLFSLVACLPRCADRLLVRHDPCEGDARSIVDTDMDELPADAACIALAFAITSDAMTCA